MGYLQLKITLQTIFFNFICLLLVICRLPPWEKRQYLTPGALIEVFRVLEASQSAEQPFKLYVVLLLQRLRPGCFLLEAFEMLIAFPSPLSSVSPPDPSSNYIRQLETKVRILEDDNKLLSQVSCARCRGKRFCISSVAQTVVSWTPALTETHLLQLHGSPESLR